MRTYAEFGPLVVKIVLLLYVLSAASFSDPSVSPGHVLSALLLSSVGLAVEIAERRRVKSPLLLLSILLVIGSAAYVDVLFLLLLPMSVQEWVSLHFRRMKAVALLLSSAPLAVVPPETALLYGLVALMSFVIGAMRETYTDRLAVRQEELERLRERVDQLTGRLNKNNEYLQQSEYTFKLEERNRLSQEIHDQVGHSMTGALIQMEAAKRVLASDPDKSAELLENAIQLSKDGIDNIRFVLKNMKPPTEQLGINRLKLMIDEFSAQHSIRTALTHQGNLDLITPIHWKIILENTQEALTNVLKYSNADAVSVRIQVLRTLIKAEVADNGRGNRKIIKGLGLIGMEERAAGLNGTVIADGSRGFSVTTLLPNREP